MPIPEESICCKLSYNTLAHEFDLLQGESPFLTSTIRKFADAAAQAEISLETLIAILESGVPIEAVFDLINFAWSRKVANHNVWNSQSFPDAELQN